MLTAVALRKLNVGCGTWPKAGWVNLDAVTWPDTDIDIIATVPPIPLPNESLSEIYAGHVLEHLDPEAGRAFLNECWRCLVPGGKLGIVVPDMYEVWRRYVLGEHAIGPDGKELDLDSICGLFIYSPTGARDHHRWCYDSKTLLASLRAAEFDRITGIDRYTDPRLVAPAWFQVGYDARKPGG